MQHSAVVAGEVRVMQAIALGEPCLACHGKTLKPELAALLEQRYPQDQARGYELGALRGAYADLDYITTWTQELPQDAFFKLSGGRIERISC